MGKAISSIVESICTVLIVLISPFGWLPLITIAMASTEICSTRADVKLTEACIVACAPASSTYENDSCNCIDKE